ncbi:sec-independent protein translocase protein TatB [bacterium BMS3Bbin12]|nr:sec-independent protein translocase protein TatB [bacterium BMS3Abin12]GBE47108.1 sec-independent protein translocase protein TatB [bacterium BMS3Bbin12]GBE51363.1 sec-independent protein translocase protein TatB [bacterium BMS3Bbin13]HDJ86159.1 twin-arginine translocase subunit TatB [Chromatiales bacterium]
MFDFGFWELVVVMVVALVVVGPERLPQIARTAGLWIGRLRRMADGVREEIQRELAAEDLKKSIKDLKGEAGFDELDQVMRETEAAMHDTPDSPAHDAKYEILEEEPEESTTPGAATESDGPAPDTEPHTPPASGTIPDAAPAPGPKATADAAPTEPRRDGAHDGTA